MGVKSTVELSREQAVRRAADLEQKAERRKIKAKYWAMTDKELEDALEALNDADLGGEGFENYTIV
jgi:hypothetical protein